MTRMVAPLALLLAVAGCTRAAPPSRDRGADPQADLKKEAGAPKQTIDAASEEKTAMKPQAGTSDAEVESYLEQIADEHPSPSRAEAEEWLVDNAARARPHLIELVESREIGLRVMGAFRVLGRIGSVEDVEVLAKLAAEEPRTIVGWHAGTALAAHATPEATRALLAIAGHSNEEIAGDAIIHLGAKADESTRAFVEGKLADKRQLIRFKAARSLEFMGPAKSVAALTARLKVEKDGEVRDAIKDALAKAKK